jgi:hypothetical protein
MSEYGASDQPRLSGWALGGITFAAAMMILIGTFQVFEGLAAIINDQFFVVTKHYAFDLDVTAWGWIHLILGIVMLLAGFGLFAAKAWAGVTALILAIMGAVANFFMIPYYPWWSILIIALCCWVIWSLTRAASSD